MKHITEKDVTRNGVMEETLELDSVEVWHVEEKRVGRIRLEYCRSLRHRKTKG